MKDLNKLAEDLYEVILTIDSAPLQFKSSEELKKARNLAILTAFKEVMGDAYREGYKLRAGVSGFDDIAEAYCMKGFDDYWNSLTPSDKKEKQP